MVVLNLRNLDFTDSFDIENKIHRHIDSFLYKFLENGGVSVKLIVGKGSSSSKFIDKKHPVRYYTEKYLNNLNLPWRNGTYLEQGQDGVIVVDL